MLPAEQGKAMVDAWRQGTQRAWETYLDVFGAPAGSAPLRPPAATDTWSEALAQGLRAWVDQAVPVANSLVDRLLHGPDSLGALFDASVAAWENVGLGGLPRPTETLRPPELGAVTEDLGELWTMYLETLQRLSRPWFEALAAPDPLEVAAHDSGQHSGLVRFGELSWDVFERTFGRLLQSPSIGFTRELNEKLLGAFSAWLEFRRANVAYQVAVSAALTRSTTTFLQELASLARKGEPIGSLRDLLGLWGDTLDGVLIESFRSEEYAKVQGNVVRAAMAYRLREREAMDVLLKIGHIPSRREVDEIARHLYELRKEVRDIQRSARQPVPEPKAEAKPEAKKPDVAAEAKPEARKPDLAAEAKPQAKPRTQRNHSDRPSAGRGKDQS